MILHIPTCNELTYKQKILSDPVTMSYNKNLNLGFDTYHNDTGCIDFPESKWNTWYSKWVNSEPDYFYAYLKVNNTYVGEVALHYIPEEDAHMISIIIESKHRNKGYGKDGLLLLLDYAFNTMNINKVIDEFNVDREASRSLFEKIGFESIVKHNMIKHSMTKEIYEKRFR